MAFNIKDEAVVEQARQLAARTGETMGEVFRRAVEERAARLSDDRERRRAEVVRLIERCRDIIGDEPLPEHGDLLYDPNTGLPR